MNGYVIIGLALVLVGFWFFRPPQAERKRKIMEEVLQERLFYESRRYSQIRGNGLAPRPVEVRLREHLPDYKNNPYLSILLEEAAGEIERLRSELKKDTEVSLSPQRAAEDFAQDN
jgi:hypothetical protein